MSQIRITPEELTTLAHSLNDNAREVRDLASIIKNNIERRTDGWEGKAKERYIRDFEQIYPTLSSKLPELLEALAKDLNQTVGAFKEADH